jgi:acetylornithine deacetylase/succinyl-diaminopimelate desuccinylase-like protein
MATQVFLVPVFREAGMLPAGDVFVTGVVLEEVGGFGSAFLAQEMPTSYAVLAEATNNQINRGHRGRVLVKVTFIGLSAHASAPERAHNPHFAAARFLLAVEHLPMRAHATFAASTVAPTIFEVDQTSANVTPATVSVYLDWRNVPGESTEDVLARVKPHAEHAAASVDGIAVHLEAVGRRVRTYTGIDAEMPPTQGFETAINEPVVATARGALEQALNRAVEVNTWTFATDGGHLSHFGITTIGFAPGEERYAHTIYDQVSIGKMQEALFGNSVLALAITYLSQPEVSS